MVTRMNGCKETVVQKPGGQKMPQDFVARDARFGFNVEEETRAQLLRKKSECY